MASLFERRAIMPIDDRNLAIGTKLSATYKKQTYTCTVEAGENGEGIAFVLEDGKRFKSPSSAAMAIIGGAANGWRFFSVETAGTGAPPTNPKGQKSSKAKASKLFKKLPPNGLEEGQHRIFCTACQKSFITTDAEPEACPEGHRADDRDLTAAPSAEAVAADHAEVTE
jgi:hypothetical protein